MYTELIGKFENSAVAMTMLVKDINAVAITQAAMASIGLIICDPAGTEVFNGNLVIADTVYDTVQTGSGATGSWNLRHIVSAATLMTYGTYTLDYKFTDSNGVITRDGSKLTISDAKTVV